MARSRTWITAVGTAIGVSAGAGAAQLGIAYGLGVITWAPATDAPGVWYASLAWVTWLAANSTIIGALVAGLIARSVGTAGDVGSARHPLGVGWQVVLALAAALGALITAPLIALPARVAQQADNAAPEFTAGGYAVAGVIIGLLVAIGALAGRAAAANIITLAALIWAVAVAAVVEGLRRGAEQPTALLGTWPVTDPVWLREMVNLSAGLGMLAIAFVVGALTAIPASRRGDNRVGVALSGAAGPVLVAAAYLLTTPGAAERDLQLSACLIAPYAVLAGIAGSVLVSAIGAAARRSNETARSAESTSTDEPSPPADQPAATAAPVTAPIDSDSDSDSADEPTPRGRFGRGLSAVRFGRNKPAEGLDSDQSPGGVAPAQRAPAGEPEPSTSAWSAITTELSGKPAKADPALFDPVGSNSVGAKTAGADPTPAVRQPGRKSSRPASEG